MASQGVILQSAPPKQNDAKKSPTQNDVKRGPTDNDVVNGATENDVKNGAPIEALFARGTALGSR